MPTVTTHNLADLLVNDIKVKVAGIDADGVLRGKIMSKDKFLSIASSGFGMSSALFGWDMHDETYQEETAITSKDTGYGDFTAIPDLETFRRIPWEDNMPFFLLRFLRDGKPIFACPRSMLQTLCEKLEKDNCKALAGVELEFTNFQSPSPTGYDQEGPRDTAAFLDAKAASALRPLTSGMFGYSITRPVANKRYFHAIYDTAAVFDCPVESWHTESGPGVFEAALANTELSRMADRVSLFKLVTKSIGTEHHITPCFMAKPMQKLPGNSGHIHISLTDLEGRNLFAREKLDDHAAWPDIAGVSDLGRHFIAGLMEALPDIMPLLAPNVNSYKRLVENYWAPVHVSWGLEDRLSSVRLVGPPTCKAQATRLEIRVPGADMHPHYALAAITAAGWRGVQRKSKLIAPLSSLPKSKTPEALPNTLGEALANFAARDSIARQLLGDEFVDFYTTTRRHELRLFREAVTDWEVRRYIEVA